MRANEFNGKRNICGDRIREARLRRRLSQSDLGGRFVADFEVVTIADILEVSVEWLLGRE